MPAKLKVDQVESVDGSANITLNNSITMATNKTLPAPSLTGNLPAISAASLTAIPAGNLTGTVAVARIADGSITAVKLAADTATQAELDTVSGVASAALPKAGGALTGAITTNSTFDGRDVAADGVLATNALPKGGGAMTGAITTNSTFDGVDIATRDGILTSTTTTAGAALPKAGGTMTGSVKGSTDTDASNTGSITLDFSTNQNFVLTLTGNVTLANPSTEAVGQSGFIACIQDGTGSRTLSLGTDYETAGAAGITLTTTASATDLVPYLVVAANRILLGAPQLAFA
jgi:hypothetical protein